MVKFIKNIKLRRLRSQVNNAKILSPKLLKKEISNVGKMLARNGALTCPTAIANHNLISRDLEKKTIQKQQYGLKLIKKYKHKFPAEFHSGFVNAMLHDNFECINVIIEIGKHEGLWDYEILQTSIINNKLVSYVWLTQHGYNKFYKSKSLIEWMGDQGSLVSWLALMAAVIALFPNLIH